MAERPEPQLDKHDKIHHELFDEDTAQVGSLGDIVEQHAGDAVFLTPPEHSPNGVDGGESDFEVEMNQTDPAGDESMDPDDEFSAADQDGLPNADLTGTVAGIARGFGTHVPQDVGRDGFQIESFPAEALKMQGRPLADGEELDDYDDDAPNTADGGALEPFTHQVSADPDDDGEPMEGRIPVRQPRPATTDEELDATRRLK